MAYINTITEVYPITERDIRAAYPDTSFPAQFAPPDEYQWVFPTPQPAFDQISEAVREIAPDKDALGKWAQQWEIVALPAEQAAANMQAAQQRLVCSVTDAVQQRLDGFARERNYDGILSLCTYATSSVPKFALEGQRGVDLRDQTWAALYTIMAEVEAGTRSMPTGFADIEPLLPVLEWPA